MKFMPNNMYVKSGQNLFYNETIIQSQEVTTICAEILKRISSLPLSNKEKSLKS